MGSVAEIPLPFSHLGLFQTPGGNSPDGYVDSDIRSVERCISHLETRMAE
jgi:hypothetical protein